MRVSTSLQKKSSKTLGKKSESLSVYKSIEDIPIWNWVKINENKNLNYLYIDESAHKYKAFPLKLDEGWIDLNQQLCDKFGFSQTYKRYFALMKRKLILRSEFIITGDTFLLNEIWIIEQDIKRLFDTRVQENFSKTMWRIRMYTKINLNPKEMSVVDYYELIEVINSEAKNKNNGNSKN